jgi:2-keto-3-deoxy-galactonokinase
MSDAAEEALAHCHVSSLLSLYYQALDRGDLATLESEVMAEDATWDLTQVAGTRRVRDRLEGRDEILAWFRRMLSGGVTMGEHGVRHFINTHVIRVDGARARSTSHLQCIHAQTMATLAVGLAEAEHVKTPRGWRIRSYRLEEGITDADMSALQETFGSR